jgi:hypothetical protein
MIDGSPMGFPDQPPVDQAGRIFVPMRAIFERLGATVVYSNGTINATRGRRTISLSIGSPTAMVNGQSVQLDSPPFLIGDRTLVPLRFVSQALGARVQWSEPRLTAYIMTAGMGGYTGYRGGSEPGYHPAYRSSYEPGHAILSRLYPEGQGQYGYSVIGATFRTQLQRDSVRVRLDGANVTQDVRFRPDGFRLSTPYHLQPGTHVIRVSGLDQNGQRVSDDWQFTVPPRR